MDIKKEVLAYIAKNAGTSFVELERLFERQHYDYRGDKHFTVAGYDNVWLWAGWNSAAFDIIAELMNEKSIKTTETTTLLYVVDGKGLDLPLVKQARDYREPHWLPVTFSVNKK